MEYTSGQFARLMGISMDTLRYYEKEELIKPSRKENNHSFPADCGFEGSSCGPVSGPADRISFIPPRCSCPDT